MQPAARQMTHRIYSRTSKQYCGVVLCVACTSPVLTVLSINFQVAISGALRVFVVLDDDVCRKVWEPAGFNLMLGTQPRQLYSFFF